ncbi:MAG: hypothetical protein ACREUF_09310 [Solimonas sp.]
MFVATCIVKVLIEVALLSLIGQGVLYALIGVFAGPVQDKNVFYMVLKTVASPVVRFARLITPRIVLDRHVGWVALFILLVAYFAAILAVRYYHYAEYGVPFNPEVGCFGR